MTRLRIGFMPVDSFKLDGLAVNAEETAALFVFVHFAAECPYSCFSDSDIGGNTLNDLVLAVSQLCYKRVAPWFLRTPEVWLILQITDDFRGSKLLPFKCRHFLLLNSPFLRSVLVTVYLVQIELICYAVACNFLFAVVLDCRFYLYDTALVIIVIVSRDIKVGDAHFGRRFK